MNCFDDEQQLHYDGQLCRVQQVGSVRQFVLGGRFLLGPHHGGHGQQSYGGQ